MRYHWGLGIGHTYSHGRDTHRDDAQEDLVAPQPLVTESADNRAESPVPPTQDNTILDGGGTHGDFSNDCALPESEQDDSHCDDQDRMDSDHDVESTATGSEDGSDLSEEPNSDEDPEEYLELYDTYSHVDSD